ncbi:MAG: adenylosuccinate synthase [Candidatus Omnitrophota bacterium]
MNTTLIGLQWGDEGKGKIVDILSAQADYIVRYQGGNNAGHTVVVEGREFIFHLLPSGILYPGKVCVIANGVVVDPRSLLVEMASLRRAGIRLSRRNLKISRLCHIIMPYHRILDKLREGKRRHKIGTTGRGIGPCYADKVARCGIRAADLINPAVFREKLRDNLREKNEVFRKVYGHPGFRFADICGEYLDYGCEMSSFLADTADLLQRAMAGKRPVLFEGAQGTLLDIDFGSYPFVTSSCTTAGGASSGCGLPPFVSGRVIGVLKAYATRVGEGPFPTEIKGRVSRLIREKGREFGATTGRPRRCGWFDAVSAAYAVRLNGAREVAITKMDVLSGLREIPVCVAYKYKGRNFTSFPDDEEALAGARPVYRIFKGWQEDISEIRKRAGLPKNARNYLLGLEGCIAAKIAIISLGSQRLQTISAPSLLSGARQKIPGGTGK